MDYQVDPAKLPVPWGKIIAVNAVITIILCLAFNLLFSLILPTSVYGRMSEMEKKNAEVQADLDKIFTKIKF